MRKAIAATGVAGVVALMPLLWSDDVPSTPSRITAPPVTVTTPAAVTITLDGKPRATLWGGVGT